MNEIEWMSRTNDRTNLELVMFFLIRTFIYTVKRTIFLCLCTLCVYTCATDREGAQRKKKLNVKIRMWQRYKGGGKSGKANMNVQI